MWQELGAGLALMLILEGILPFLNPEAWRQAMDYLAKQDNRVLRKMGFVSMLIGVGLLYWVR